MNEKKDIDKNQIWLMIMVILPVIILMNAGKDLTDDNSLRIVYAGVFGGIGGALGYLANFLTKDKSRTVKILTTAGLITIIGITITTISPKSSDAEELHQEWITQMIGEIEFDSPIKLKLLTNKIPASLNWLYAEMNVYSDNNNQKSTSFIQSKILIDTLKINDAFAGALTGMLQKINIDLKDVELEVFASNEKEVSSMFSFKLNKEDVNGYGYMYMNEETLESIWLMPLKRGFSIEYIEKFEAGIFSPYY